jgi:ribonuclease R
VFAGRISGVTRFGLFVTLAETGASGIVPMSSLDDDFWVHDETQQALIGRRTGKTWRLAQPVEVRLAEAAPLTGGLMFQIQPAQTQPALTQSSGARAPSSGSAARRGRRH